MNHRTALSLLPIGLLAGCAIAAAPATPAPVLAALECAEGVVDRYGFIDRDENWVSYPPVIGRASPLGAVTTFRESPSS